MRCHKIALHSFYILSLLPTDFQVALSKVHVNASNLYSMPRAVSETAAMIPYQRTD